VNEQPSDVLPFARYQGGGRVPLGPPDRWQDTPRTASARTGYGLSVAKHSDGRCAYCSADLTSTYEAWLNLSLEHVVPQGPAQSPGINPAWLRDLANCVLCCRACNEFLNQYRPRAEAATWDEFIQLRDRVFAEKRALARRRHASEREAWAELRQAGWLAAPGSDST